MWWDVPKTHFPSFFNENLLWCIYLNSDPFYTVRSIIYQKMIQNKVEPVSETKNNCHFGVVLFIFWIQGWKTFGENPWMGYKDSKMHSYGLRKFLLNISWIGSESENGLMLLQFHNISIICCMHFENNNWRSRSMYKAVRVKELNYFGRVKSKIFPRVGWQVVDFLWEVNTQ